MTFSIILKKLITSFALLAVLLYGITGAYADKTKTLSSKKHRNVNVQKTSGDTRVIEGYTIGLLLPLTGRYAAYGNKALEAALLAAGVFDVAKESPLKLIIEDSKSDSEVARAAVNKLANVNKVICIIGPIGRIEDREASTEAQKIKIPILTLSQKERITDIGNYVFRNFFTNSTEIKALVKYVMQDLGLTKFAVLYPNDSYGQEMTDLFKSEVLRSGGTIRKLQSYEESQTDFGDEIRAIGGMKSLDERIPQEQTYIDVKPIIDFEAIFIPDSYTKVGMIVPQLVFYNIRGVQLLGTSNWNSPELLKTGSEYLERAVFVDGFFLNSFYPEVNDFIDQFYAAYGREPDVMEAMVFDTLRITVKVLEENNIDTREKFRKSLLQLKSYSGVTGMTSFSGNRDARKEAFILMVKNGQIIQIK